ncbi:hypothetical protein P5F77_02145 [Caldifermentibacillus hisashii]|uniref:hypothetical protein n=1 Tax=Caldifermentibacillus hisashii TaxID=996558 RepID=UPI0030D65A01
MKVYSILLFCAAILLLMPGRHVFAQEELQLMSESAVLMDAKSGQILYGKKRNGKNESRQHYENCHSDLCDRT